MITSHAPGPWIVDDGQVISVQPQGNYVIGAVYEAEDFPCLDAEEDGEYERIQAQVRANATLIATAPDLLEACEEAICILTGYSRWEEAVEAHIGHIECPYHFLAIAIAKAQGSQP